MAMLYPIIIINIILLVLKTDLIESACRTTYVTKCDHLDDINSFSKVQVENWRHLVIGDDNAQNSLYRGSIMKIRFTDLNKLKSLTILNQLSDIEAIYGNQCDYGNQMESLVFYGNYFRTLQPHSFPLFKLLREFILVNNSIEKIDEDAFYEHSIEYLDLSDNKLEEIKHGALSSVFNLKIVRIVNNRLSHIDRVAFPSTLEILNLDRNNLRYINREVLENLKNLKELTLSANKFTSPQADFKLLSSLRVLDLSYNEVTECDSSLNELSNLELLDLSNNKLTSSRFLDSLLSSKKGKTFQISLAFNNLRNLNIQSSSLDLYRFRISVYGNLWDCKEWDKERYQIEKIQYDCDNEFFNSGKTPYCLNHAELLQLFLPQRKAEYERFLTVIKANENDVSCDLHMEKANVLYPVAMYCIKLDLKV